MNLNRAALYFNAMANDIRFCHWGSIGKTFYQDHKLLDKIYKYLNRAVDDLMEASIEHGEETLNVNCILEDYPYTCSGTIQSAELVLGYALDVLDTINSENKGISNLVGQLYQDISKFKNYYLAKMITEVLNEDPI